MFLTEVSYSQKRNFFSSSLILAFSPLAGKLKSGKTIRIVLVDDHPGRFVGFATVPALGGKPALDEMERDGLRVLERRISLPPLRKLWIAWRTARREQHRARRHQALAG